MLTHGTISRIRSPYVILQPYCKIECEPHVCAFSIHVEIYRSMSQGGIFRTLSNILDGRLCKNSSRLLAVNYFHKTLHLRY